MLARSKVESERYIDVQQESYVGARKQHGNLIIYLKLTFLQMTKVNINRVLINLYEKEKYSTKKLTKIYK